MPRNLLRTSQLDDAYRLPQPDASFNTVLSAHLLEHLTRPEEAINEMVRVLRPGAPLVIVATRGNLAGQLIRLKWHHVPIRAESSSSVGCAAPAWKTSASTRSERFAGEPGGIMDWIGRPETADRHGGHGTSKITVMNEVSAAGFQVMRGPESWRGRTYAVMFRRP
jgi:SAM-dependent methyltransferase